MQLETQADQFALNNLSAFRDKIALFDRNNSFKPVTEQLPQNSGEYFATFIGDTQNSVDLQKVWRVIETSPENEQAQDFIVLFDQLAGSQAITFDQVAAFATQGGRLIAGKAIAPAEFRALKESLEKKLQEVGNKEGQEFLQGISV